MCHENLDYNYRVVIVATPMVRLAGQRDTTVVMDFQCVVERKACNIYVLNVTKMAFLV